MKKILKTLSVITVLFVSAGLQSTASAAKDAATIAVIDINLIMSESKAAKSLNEQMTALRSKYEKEIFKKEEVLRGKEKELEKLTGAKLEEARSKLESEVAEFQKSIMMQQNQLQAAAQKAFEQIRQKIITISSGAAEKEGYRYVQPSAAFIVFPLDSDITKKAIELLDKELPTVKVEVEVEAEAKAKAKK